MTMGNIVALRYEVRRCEELLARPIPLGALGRLLTWRSRRRVRRALEKALELLVELRDALQRDRDAVEAMERK